MKKELHATSHKAIYFSPPVFKRTLLALGLLCSFSFAGAQSFDLGLSGSVGVAYLLNRNFFASGTDQSYRLTLSDNYGLQGAVNFKGGYTFEFDVLDGTLRQGYSGTFSSTGGLPARGIGYDAGESYTGEAKIDVIEIPLLYRYTHKSGSYFELGMEYEMISSASYSASYSNPNFNVSYVTTTAYSPAEILLVAGLGKNKRLGGSKFYFNYGVRFTYGVKDLEGVDGHGQYLNGPSGGMLYVKTFGPYYETYHQTHPFDLSLNAGIFYRFAIGGIHDREIEF
jgi:hypothetical protein